MEINVNPIVVQNLFRMESYTDANSGTIFRQIPVTITGERDPMRQEAFGGSCTLLINGQPMPIQFPIEATSLEEAINNFPDAVKSTIQSMHDEQVRQKILMPGTTGLPANNRRR